MGVSDMIHDGTVPGIGHTNVNIDYIPPGFADYYKEAFDYNIVINPATAGVVVTGSANVQNDSYFVWVSGMCTIWDAATQRTTNIQPNVAPLLVTVRDTASGKALVDQPTPIGNVFGTGLQPVVWLYRAKVFLPGGQITAEITNQLAADQTVRLTFNGFKIYNVADASAPRASW